MITLEDCKQAGSYEYKGLSTDTKPLNCAVNSLFLELDTGIFYFFNGTEWKNINERITLGESEPTGTITITNNGIFDVHDYAEADVNVPAIIPTGTISITENGTVDVANYATAEVDVDYATVNFNLSALTRSIPTGLIEDVAWPAATTVGDYALFGGGILDSGYSRQVTAYNSSLIRITPTQLELARERMGSTSVGNYALFGGGDQGYSTNTSAVDAYDTSLTRTTRTNLSQGRARLSATTVKNYALFGGGHPNSGYSSVVDAYDTSLTRTTPMALSQARGGVAATTVGNYALFGGGYGDYVYYSNVDAYSTDLTRTTPTVLTQPRGNIGATMVAPAGDSAQQSGYALFAGGHGGDRSQTIFFSSVDAYNDNLTRTTPAGLSQARNTSGATTVAPTGGSNPQSGYALFGGGNGSSGDLSVVDVYDQTLTKIVSPAPLSRARGNLAATTVGNYALMGGGSKSAVVDAYSLASYDIQVFPETKYSFNGSTEQTSSTWQTISMQGEVVGYIKVKNATVN